MSVRKIVIFTICFALCLSFGVAVPHEHAHAAEGTGTSEDGSFWQQIVQHHVAGNETVLDTVLQYVAGNVFDSICPVSDDGLHHASSIFDYPDGNYYGNCTYCGEGFQCTDVDLENGYDEYMQAVDLEDFSVDSNGQIIWHASVDDIVYPFDFGSWDDIPSLPFVHTYPYSSQYFSMVAVDDYNLSAKYTPGSLSGQPSTLPS